MFVQAHKRAYTAWRETATTKSGDSRLFVDGYSAFTTVAKTPHVNDVMTCERFAVSLADQPLLAPRFQILEKLLQWSPV